MAFLRTSGWMKVDQMVLCNKDGKNTGLRRPWTFWQIVASAKLDLKDARDCLMLGMNGN